RRRTPGGWGAGVRTRAPHPLMRVQGRRPLTLDTGRPRRRGSTSAHDPAPLWRRRGGFASAAHEAGAARSNAGAGASDPGASARDLPFLALGPLGSGASMVGSGPALSPMARHGARVPRLVAGVDLTKLPLSPLEGLVLSRIDGLASVALLADLTNLEVAEVEAMVERLIALGAAEWVRESVSLPRATGREPTRTPSAPVTVPPSLRAPPRAARV